MLCEACKLVPGINEAEGKMRSSNLLSVKVNALYYDSYSTRFPTSTIDF